MAFTICLSFVLLFLIDWHALFSCDSEEMCRNVSVFYKRPFSEFSLWRFAVVLSFSLFLAYLFFNTVVALQQIRDAWEISAYYKDRLKIPSDGILATMTWSEVLQRLIRQQKAARFCIVQDHLTALEIANIILREDNFMVAFANQHAFISRLPPLIPSRLVYTRAVLWNIRTAIFHWMFDSRSRIRSDFLNNPSLLARRFRWMGIMNLVLVVPVLIFVTIYYFMRHAEEFRSRRTSPFQRQWTDYAQWTFREFVELPHQFVSRLCRAREAAEHFESSARPITPLLSAVLRCVKFVAGALLAVLLLVALLDDTPLLFVKIYDKNLLWYLALFGFIFAVADSAEAPEPWGGKATASRGSGSGKGGGSSVSSSATGSGGIGSKLKLTPLRSLGAPLRMYVAMMELVRCTHYLPPLWRSHACVSLLAGGPDAAQRAGLCQHFAQVRSDFLRNFFARRIQILAEELLGVVLAPIILIIYLPRAAPDIVDIVRRSRYASPNLGDWCAFGCLDPTRNGGEFYGAGRRRPYRCQRAEVDLDRMDSAMAAGSGTLRPVTSFDEETPPGTAAFAGNCKRWNENRGSWPLISNEGKLEKSLITFVHAHYCRNAEVVRDELGSGCEGHASRSGITDRGALRNLSTQAASSADVALQAIAGVVGPFYDSLSARNSSGENRTSQRSLRTKPDLAQELSQFVTDATGSDIDHTSASGGVGHHNDPTVSSGPLWAAHSRRGVRGGFDVETQDCVSSGLLRAGDGSGGDDKLVEWHAEGPPQSPREVELWGYPSSVLDYMSELEDFRSRELAISSPRREWYGMLPEELLACRPLVLSASATSHPPSSGVTDEEAEEAGCGAHFFWLEVLYDLHSARICASCV
eukprot:TRINITY_DN10481_c0_g1_i1.p1 TRINITY_DN10481_c0_g1~~TRINITY_DN10481_c0_g1_i1.p1  ORF type:complete len:961 (-),score=109.69 TRINITY_DN10481_c0_g1_i1:833-3427(-)